MRLWRVKHFHEIGRNLYKRPEVFFLTPNHFSILTDPCEYFWYDLNGGRPADPTARAWRGYTNGKAFITDTQGTERYRDVISGNNLKKESPRIKCLVCGGNVVTGEVVGKNLIVKTLRGPKNKQEQVSPPWGMTYENTPWLIHQATNRQNGDVVNPFGHFGGRNTGKPVYYPLVGWKPVKLPLAWLEEVDEIPNPYNPPMP